MRRMKYWLSVAGLLLTAEVGVASSIDTGSLDSDALGVTKNYVVYLPDGYEESEKYYPVIYVLHGTGVTERIWTSPDLDIKGLADNLGLQAIIVMPDSDRNVYINALTTPDYEGCLTAEQPYPNNSEARAEFCVRTLNYEDYFLTEIIPHIESTYRALPVREARALSGESGGGLSAMQLALRNPSLFSSVASHSGILSLLYDSEKQERMSSVDEHPGLGNFEAMLGRDIERWQQYEPWSLVDNIENGQLSIYLDCGTEDSFFIFAQQFHDKLTALGIAHTYEWMEGGGHTDAQFKAGMKIGLEKHLNHFQRQGVYAE